MSKDLSYLYEFGAFVRVVKAPLCVHFPVGTTGRITKVTPDPDFGELISIFMDTSIYYYATPEEARENLEVWKPIDQDRYNYWLGVLPPIYGPNGMFAVSESLRHNAQGHAVYTVCWADPGNWEYWQSEGTIAQMKTSMKPPTQEELQN